jgi:hypothetical protein
MGETPKAARGVGTGGRTETVKSPPGTLAHNVPQLVEPEQRAQVTALNGGVPLRAISWVKEVRRPLIPSRRLRGRLGHLRCADKMPRVVPGVARAFAGPIGHRDGIFCFGPSPARPLNKRKHRRDNTGSMTSRRLPTSRLVTAPCRAQRFRDPWRGVSPPTLNGQVRRSVAQRSGGGSSSISTASVVTHSPCVCGRRWEPALCKLLGKAFPEERAR